MWLIQNNIFGDEQNKMLSALVANGVTFKVTNKPDYDSEVSMIRGSVEFVHSFQSKMGGNQYMNLGKYAYTKYSKGLDMLNSDYVILPWFKVKSKEHICKFFPEYGRLFIRPVSGRKIFTGTHLGKLHWNKELEIIAGLPGSDIKETDLVVVAPYNNIQAESRVLMKNHQVLGISSYGEYEEKIDEEFVRKSIPKFAITGDELYTIDVCLNSQRELKIVEINSGVCAGWYDMDYNHIVKSIEKKPF